MPWRSPGHPKSSQIRRREALGTPRGAQERPKGVLGASRERLGTSPASTESVRRVPKGGSGCHRRRPGAPGSAPKQPKSMLSRVRKRKKIVFSTRCVREASVRKGCQWHSQCYARGHCSPLRPTFPPLRTPHGFACSVASLSRCPCHYRPGRCNFRRAALVERPLGQGKPSTQAAGHNADCYAPATTPHLGDRKAQPLPGIL